MMRRLAVIAIILVALFVTGTVVTAIFMAAAAVKS